MSASPAPNAEVTTLYDHDIPAEYQAFFRLFNEGDFFEAHEVLEDLWAIEVSPLKNYYKGLIQASVAICHWERGNLSGARKLWRSAHAYLAPYPQVYEGFRLGDFLHDLDRLFGPLTQIPHTHALLQRDLIPRLALSPKGD